MWSACLVQFMSEIIEHFTGHERPVTQSLKQVNARIEMYRTVCKSQPCMVTNGDMKWQVSYQKKCYWFYVIFHLVLSTVAFYIMVVSRNCR